MGALFCDNLSMVNLQIRFPVPPYAGSPAWLLTSSVRLHMLQLDSAASQLLLAAWRPPYAQDNMSRHLQTRLHGFSYYPGRMCRLVSKRTQVRGMRTRPVSCHLIISYPEKLLCSFLDKTDIGVRVYIANIFTFTTLIDRFTSCVCVSCTPVIK